jgi:hypothetical protein
MHKRTPPPLAPQARRFRLGSAARAKRPPRSSGSPRPRLPAPLPRRGASVVRPVRPARSSSPARSRLRLRRRRGRGRHRGLARPARSTCPSRDPSPPPTLGPPNRRRLRLGDRRRHPPRRRPLGAGCRPRRLRAPRHHHSPSADGSPAALRGLGDHAVILVGFAGTLRPRRVAAIRTKHLGQMNGACGSPCRKPRDPQMDAVAAPAVCPGRTLALAHLQELTDSSAGPAFRRAGCRARSSRATPLPCPASARFQSRSLGGLRHPADARDSRRVQIPRLDGHSRGAAP